MVKGFGNLLNQNESFIFEFFYKVFMYQPKKILQWIV